MSYVGNTPALKYVNFAVQHFSTSATASYTLDQSVSNEVEIALFINNVRQEPGSSYAYTATGTALTLSQATAGSDTMYCVFIGKAVETNNPPAGSVNTSEIVDNAVSTAKVQSDAITYDKIQDLASANRVLGGATTGTVGEVQVVDGMTNFVSTSSVAGLQIKGDGTTDGTLQLNCSQNTHGIKIKSPPHSASASYTLTMPTTDGNSSQFLQTNGSGVLTWADSGGVWVRTHYTEIGNAGATQIDFTGLSSSYEVYKFYFVNIRPETDDVYMKFFMNVGGSFQTGNSYGYAIRLIDTDQTLGSAASPEDNGFARVQVNGTGNATGETLNGEITIFDPSGTTNYNVITTNFNSINTGGKSSSNVGVISNMSSASALTGIRIKFSSGKMLAGGLIIGYGLKA